MRRKWQEILAAKELLGLGDLASMQEIRASYRKLAKLLHPDLALAEERVRMQEINAAYALLLEYCATVRVPLTPGDDASAAMDPEEWWLDRFGEDPLWGRKREG